MSAIIPGPGNWLYTSQRWTGIIAFIYILYHVIDMRFTGVHLMGGGYNSAFSKVWFDFQSPWMVAVLRYRNRGRVVALRLWRVAICRQVGTDRRRERAPQVRLMFALRWRLRWSASGMWSDQRLRNEPRPIQVPWVEHD